MKHLLVWMLMTAASTAATAQVTLQSTLERLATGFRGDVGIYVEHLGTGETAAVNADTVFPTASMIKIPILAGVFAKMEAGELEYNGTHAFDTTRIYPGEDVIASFRQGEPVSLHKLSFLMVSFSDNTASLWLQELAGTGTTINALMEDLGLRQTRVNSRTPGRETDRSVYGWGQTTPREMATLVKRIHEGRVVSPAASHEMLRLMTKTLWDKESISRIPPWVAVASKQGAVNRSRSEVYLVYAPTGAYVVCFVTKNQEDVSWANENEGWIRMREVSEAVWNHFVPDQPWTAPQGSARYQ
jgi:beta-lactamase class A